MTTNLLSLAQSVMGSDFSSLASQFLGESPGATQGALTSLLPAVLGGVAQKGATPDGATDLMGLINRSNLDVGSLGNIAGLFGGGSGGANALMKAGTSLVPALFGDKSGALISALSSASGVKSSTASNLVAMVVPIVLMLIKKLIGEKGLNASSLSSLLAGQGPNLQGALDSRLTSALGFPNPSAFLGTLGSTAADTARRTGAAIAGSAATAGHAGPAAGTAAVAASKSGLQRWLPWIIGAIILGLLWWMMMAPKAPAPVPPKAVATAPTPAAPAPAAAAMAGFPAKVYFDTGSAAVGADGAKVITGAADAIKKDGLKVALTGYTDKTGDTAKNEELAKSRAVAV
ncbi:MAG TPA: DUF937 domain-containing protein, partial [Casimicrobiaceae bacterium]